MVVIEILIYVLFAWVMVYMAKQSVEQFPEDQEVHWDRFIWYYILFFTVICAFRYAVGGDFFSYARIFNEGEVVERRADEEIIWNNLVIATHSTGLGSIFGFGVCAFVQIFFIVKSCEKCRYLLIAVPVALFGSRYFMDLTGAIRQMMAAAILLWACKFIVERKLVKYALCVIVASMLHHSAIVMLLLYFIPNTLHLAAKRVPMLIVFVVCFILGRTPSFGSVVHYLEAVTNMAGYENYSDRVLDYAISGNAEEALAFGPMMLSYFLIAVILIWCGPYLKDKYEDRIPVFNLWYNLGFLYACAYFLVCNVSHIFIRPVQYLELFQMMIVSVLLYDLWIKSATGTREKYRLIAFVVIIWTNTCWDIYKHTGMPIESVLYKLILLQ